MSEGTRGTYETLWYDEPVTCCSSCHFIQFEDGPNHPAWCDLDSTTTATDAPSAEVTA
jgi:hypothetical protein